MLDNGIIRPSQSLMASPLVCVLKGKKGCNGVRLVVDYRYANRYTQGDAYPLPHMASVRYFSVLVVVILLVLSTAFAVLSRSYKAM